MGSLFSALTTAVAGLDAQSSAIGNISDNLANSQTTGYKSVGTNFEELVTASTTVVNNPGGVRATPQYQNGAQGAVISSSTPTSLAISGSGYFQVETGVATASGTTQFTGQQYYTREGDFKLDKNGYMVNGSGYYLTGYAVSKSTGVVDTSSTGPIQISALQNNPVAASNITYNANLPSNAAIGFTAPTSTVQIYDAYGAQHAADYTWSKTGTNTWSLEISIPDGKDSNSNAYDTKIPFTFSSGSSGTAGTISAVTAYTASGSPPTSPYTAPGSQTAGALADVSIGVSFQGGASQAISLDFGSFNSSSGVTQFSDTNTSVAISDFSQDGLPKGSFTSVQVDNNGFVALNYSNGTSQKIGQIPIAQFFAEDELQRVTGGAFVVTEQAGNARLSAPGASGAGTISANSLEQSNVDISTEFTNLIQSQQVYAANAKVVTTSNSMLQTTINMIQ